MVDEHRLEAPLQGGVLFDVAAVLVGGGGADGPQLAPGQGRLQQVAGVHGPFRRSRAHHRVQLVDEENYSPGGFLYLLQHRLEPLLELAPVLGPCQQGAHVQGDYLLVLQALGDVAGHDPPGQPFHNGRLPHPGIADQDRVVLGPAGEDLHHPPDLLIPPDDRVQLPFPGQGGQVPPVALQGLEGPLGIIAGNALGAAHRPHRQQQLVPLQPQALEQLLQVRLPLLRQGQEEMLHADVVILEGLRLPLRPAQHPGQGGAHLQEALVAVNFGYFIEQFLQFRPEQLRVHPGLLEQAGGNPLLLVQKRRHQVVRPHDLVVAVHGDLLGRRQRLPRFYGEPVQIHPCCTCLALGSQLFLSVKLYRDPAIFSAAIRINKGMPAPPAGRTLLSFAASVLPWRVCRRSYFSYTVNKGGPAWDSWAVDCRPITDRSTISLP